MSSQPEADVDFLSDTKSHQADTQDETVKKIFQNLNNRTRWIWAAAVETIDCPVFNSSARLLAADMRNEFSEELGEIPKDTSRRGYESGMGENGAMFSQ